MVDVNIGHSKSSNYRIGNDLNANSTQSSPSSYTFKVSPTDLRSPNGATRHPSGSRLAEPKAHNRQTSIVHGYQHSRNGSIASSISAPLSSQTIAIANGERTDTFNMDSSSANFISPTTNPIDILPPNKIAASDQVVPAIDDATQAPGLKRLGRLLSSGRENKDHRHHPSYSRPLKEELKTVSEYTLHVLFTSVSTSGTPSSTFKLII